MTDEQLSEIRRVMEYGHDPGSDWYRSAIEALLKDIDDRIAYQRLVDSEYNEPDE